jgi:hypothetical protein
VIGDLMQRFRIALTLLAAVAVLLDLNEFLIIQQHGFPPDPSVDDDGRILFVAASTRDQVQYSLFLLGFGLVQAFVFRLTWKAWRR